MLQQVAGEEAEPIVLIEYLSHDPDGSHRRASVCRVLRTGELRGLAREEGHEARPVTARQKLEPVTPHASAGAKRSARTGHRPRAARVAGSGTGRMPGDLSHRWRWALAQGVLRPHLQYAGPAAAHCGPPRHCVSCRAAERPGNAFC